MRRFLTIALPLVLLFALVAGCGKTYTIEWGEGTWAEGTEEVSDARVACLVNLRRLDGAIVTYVAATGRDPQSLNDLVPVYLKKIPDEPLGGDYMLVPASGSELAHAECSKGHK